MGFLFAFLFASVSVLAGNANYDELYQQALLNARGSFQQTQALPTIMAVDGATQSDVAHTNQWLTFFKSNLKCFNQNIRYVYISGSATPPAEYTVFGNGSTAVTIDHSRIFYNDQVNGYYIYQRDPLYRHGHQGRSSQRLYISEPRVSWAEQLSTCPDLEHFTVAGVGSNQAKTNLKLATPLPDHDVYMGLLLPLPSHHDIIAYLNVANSCQSFSYHSDRMKTHVTYVPYAARDTLAVFQTKLKELWRGNRITLNGFTSAYDVSLTPKYREALQEAITSKTDGLVLRLSNLKMLGSPDAEENAKLANAIVVRLAKGKWTHILMRTGKWDWHSQSVVSAKPVRTNKGTDYVFYIYDSNSPYQLQQIHYSSDRRDFTLFSSSYSKGEPMFAWYNQKLNEGKDAKQAKPKKPRNLANR